MERIKQLEEFEKKKQQIQEFKKRSIMKNSSDSVFKFDEKKNPYESAYRIPIRPETKLPVFQKKPLRKQSPHTPVQKHLKFHSFSNSTPQPDDNTQPNFQIDDHDFQQLGEF